MAKLTGKVAVITGAAMGLGAGIAKVYAKYEAKLALIDISPELEPFAESLRKEGAEVITFKADVTNAAELKEIAKKVVDHYGRIDVLNCIAGVCRLENFMEMSDEIRDFHIDVNIKGVWNITKACLPYMLEQGKGSIVVMSSVTGDIVADPGEVAYALSKAALVGFTKALAVEYAQKGIRANAMQLGYARTPMVDGMAKQTNPDDPESVLTDMAKAIPMRRLADPTELGELAAFLGSDESSYITGSQFVIDGGSTLPESVSMGV